MKQKALIAVFATQTSKPTEIGMYEFSNLPNSGDLIELSSQPILRVDWLKFVPESDKFDAIIGCEYHDLYVARMARSDDDASSLVEKEPEAIIINKTLNENKKIIIETQSRAFEKSAAYTNVIVIAGYAAAFTIWSNTKSSLLPREVGLVAGLILFSFCSFVLYELSRMVVTSLALRRAAAASVRDPLEQDYFSKVVAADVENQLRTVKFMKWWPLSILVTVIPILAAVGILLYRFGNLIIFG